MSIQQSIEDKLTQQLNPAHLAVENESQLHNVPPGSESHFKVTVVSERFEGKSLLARHRMINACLEAELAGPIHALSIHTLTPQEWAEKGGKLRPSPPCMGGSKQGG
jgi:BolA protein